MITLLLALSLVISLGLLVTAYIIIKRLLAKIDTYEGWIKIYEERILNAQTRIGNTLEKMREIDKSVVFSSRVNDRGAFESDDQLGGSFKELESIVEELKNGME
jgi:hypothetical protein